MKTSEYCLHSDPDHGWLCVEREEIARLGLSDKISDYSYESGLVYLEEDCDAPLFVRAKLAAGETCTIVRVYSDIRSGIRSLNAYKN